MNRITKHTTRVMRPEAALIVYSCENEYPQKEYFLEFRNIGKDGLMEAGKPVSQKFIHSLVENFSTESSSVLYGKIPQRMMYVHSRKGKYVWHTSPCRKYLYFTTNLNIPNGEYCIPGLVWMVDGESLYLFAYKAKRLTPNTQLFSAPFFNVTAKDGSVCLGNAKLKPPQNLIFLNFMQYWEDKFFLSEFAHVLGGNPTKTNLVLVTLNSTQSFDNSELLPIKKLKIKDLMK